MKEKAAMFLLGAGASAHAGVPMAYRMTDSVYKLITNRDAAENRSQISGLLYFLPKAITLIEHVYRVLRERNTDVMDVELFGAAVDSAAKLDLEQVAPILISELTKVPKGSLSPILDDLRKEAEVAPTLFRQAVSQLTWLTASVGPKLSYLNWIVNLLMRSPNPTIASLNYDNAIELTCANLQISYSYGFESGWLPHDSLSFENRSLAIVKLHGSSNWSLGESVALDSRHDMHYREPWSKFATRIYSQIEMDHMANKRFGHRHAILFGRGIKIIYDGPFMALHDAFRKRLETHSIVVVVGYSFRDKHINDDLTSWAQRQKERKIIVVSPAASALYKLDGSTTEPRRLHQFLEVDEFQVECIDLCAQDECVPDRVLKAIGL